MVGEREHAGAFLSRPDHAALAGITNDNEIITRLKWHAKVADELQCLWRVNVEYRA